EKKLQMAWSSLEEAEKWMQAEATEKIFDFSRKEVRPNKKSASSKTTWYKKLIYICSRGSTGGKARYIRKYAWTRKKPRRHCGCKCRLTLTLYNDTDDVQGLYFPEHMHELGAANVRFTRVPESAKRE
ncbi:hypothetical protein BKA70DRAFT_1032132, partial [Coprinopsis sp. MPI-PUGE-AT-0042]